MKNSKSARKLLLLSILISCGIPLSMLFTNCAESSFEASESQGDPLLPYAWYFKNTGQKVFASAAGTAGVDLNIIKTWDGGISGRGVKILISDDGIEDTHQDLSANYLYGNQSRVYTLPYPFLANSSPPLSKEDNHGTAVAGLVAAVANNGFGSKGVAFGASIASANFLSDSVTPTEPILVDQIRGDFDIFNMSWGSTQNSMSKPLGSFHTQLRSGALTGRSGKGSIYVKAAGNNFTVKCAGQSTNCLGNANFDSDNSSPFLILVGALNAKGEAASYSSPGANIWISSFGGEFGDDTPAMVTTDRSTCAAGFSVSNSASALSFERGANGNAGCSYSVAFNGTSSAAPVLTGVVALLLEANPNLTWRDVKYILAKTAVKIYPNISITQHPDGLSIPTEYEHPWVTNGAGFHFHNWFGFGRVNVDAAVTMAKSYTSSFGKFTEVDFDNNKRTATVNIGDNDFATAAEDSMTVTTNLKIESVQLRLAVSHGDISQLGVELTSPAGTKSYLVNMRNSLTGLSGYVDYEMQSNAFYQERTQGTWKIKVIDAVTGTTGNLTGWSLRFTGAP